MSCDIDELDVNPFYRALQTTYYDLYEKAQAKCYLICVPQKSSLIGADINQKLLETHILRPSPYFKGQYITVNSDRQTVSLEDGDRIIKTVQGFSEERKIKIINEEVAYNKSYAAYKIIILDQPFDSIFTSFGSPSTSNKESINDHLIPKSTFTESKCFLQSVPEFSKAFLNIDKATSDFNQHYMVLEDYLDDVADRIRTIVADLAEKCLICTKKKPLYSDTRFKDVIYGAVESYFLGMVHNKVFTVICNKYVSEDNDLLQKCHHLKDVTPLQLEIPKQFTCSLPTAIFELTRLKDYHTPREKLNTLKAVIDSITMEIQAHVDLNKQKLDKLALTKTEDPCLTSDNLIPLLVTVIAEAKPNHLESDLYYMEYFNWNSTIKDMDDISYCLVTFKAAVQYMQTTNFDALTTKSKKEGLSDLFSGIKINLGGTTSTDANESSTSMFRKEKKPNKLSTLLLQDSQVVDSLHTNKSERKIKSIFDDSPRRSPNMQSQNTENGADALGDFLSGLQDDPFNQPFGKQS